MSGEAFPPIKEYPVSRQIREIQERSGGAKYARTFRLYRMGDCAIFVSRDPFGPGDKRWHISVSCPDRDPTWEELKHVQNELKPGVFFCVPMPPREFWMSVHDHAFHLEEVKDPASIEQWKHEGRSAR